MFDGDPDHPILEKPWTYDIASIAYHHDLGDWRGSYVDLTLVRGPVVRRLRFLIPSDFEIEKGFPHGNPGLRILDVRRRQLEDINIRVDNVDEPSGGAVRFWAREVVDLDEGVPHRIDAGR